MRRFTNCDAYGFVSPAGLSPDLQSMEQIRRIMRPTDVPDTGGSTDMDTVKQLIVMFVLETSM